MKNIPEDISEIMERTDLQLITDVTQADENEPVTNMFELGQRPELAAGLRGFSATPSFTEIDDLFDHIRRHKDQLLAEYGDEESPASPNDVPTVTIPADVRDILSQTDLMVITDYGPAGTDGPGKPVFGIGWAYAEGKPSQWEVPIFEDINDLAKWVRENKKPLLTYHGTKHVNLKKILMDLGNKLVTEHGMDPATVRESRNPHGSTIRIKLFTDWINSNEMVRAALADMNIDWPMPPK